jgi:hypothetical protein
MSTSIIVDPKTGNAFTRITLPSAQASTYHAALYKLDAIAAVAEAEADSIIRDAYEELEWHNIVNTPRVRQTLRRLAAEARQQYYAGETEEGGFAVE